MWQQEHLVAEKSITNQVAASAENSQQAKVIPSATQQNTQGISLDKQKVPASRIIKIKTDVLDVDIDTLGGNIIGVSLLKYPVEFKSNQPFLLLNNNSDTLYISQNGIISSKNGSQKLLQFNTKQNNFVLGEKQKQLPVQLNAVTSDGIKVTKTYIFTQNKYNIKVNYEITNNSGKLWNGNYYMQLTRVSTPPAKKSTFSLRSFYGASVSSARDPYQKFHFKDLAKKPINEDIKNGWLAMVQHYFIGAWIPDAMVTYNYYSKINNDGTTTVGAISPEIIVKPGATTNISSSFYVGPKIAKRLDAISPYLAKTVDYGFLWFIAIILFKVMKFFYDIVGNWGWSIVLVTILIKLIFYQLSASSYKSMAGMRKLQPKMARLKEQYGDNKQAYSKAVMELYKKEKINPLGGCLPIIIQLPVFFALYWVLLESVELRQAPFIFWIHDLSVKDPYYVLPILMGISMYIQQKLSPSSPDPTQAKVMMFLPVIMTVFFLNFPAGLVLYWLVNNVISVIQQWYIIRKFEHGGYKKKYKNNKDKNKPWWKIFPQR
jgi:YidC/Oxa1 family membrane protein insertase